MTRYAIIMSVENYKHFQPTQFTHADNDLIYSTLTKKCDYADQHVIVFKLSPENPKSPSEILTEIKSTVLNSTSGDSILFYFAGHGHYHEDKSYLILPDTFPGAYETTALMLDDLSNELRVHERSCFRLFDACHSGIDVRDGGDNPNSQDFIRSVNHDASGWVTLAACKEDEYSISDPSIGHGIFTHYLCDEISAFNPEEQILPEILKVKITDKVLKHSKKLGYSQTLTLNASISGNISIATRRANIITSSETNEAIEEDQSNRLDLRIAKLKEVKDVLTDANLKEVLENITQQCLDDFRKLNSFSYDISLGTKILANDIPEEMHSFVVNFSRNIGIQPRHDLERYEEEYNDPFGSFNSFFQKRKKRISYSISQSKYMPPSASIIDLKGDGRCLPNIKILIYVIPLQITGCILISVFNFGCRDNVNNLELIKNYYQMFKPDDSFELIKKIGPFSSKDAMEKITNIINKRIDLLEKELSG
jgi:hypothetical protein